MKNNSEEVSEHVCVEHQVNQATNVVLQDNIVAGFERVAYRINGEPCPGRTNSTEMIFILKQKFKKKSSCCGRNKVHEYSPPQGSRIQMRSGPETRLTVGCTGS